jgi:16S rRNA (guanine527-N7)-methyltransferase
MSDADTLNRGLALLDVPDAGRVAPILERYLAEIGRWNPRFGLVKAEGDELVVKHALDSLSAWRIVRDLAEGPRIPARPGARSVLDVGSGAGFPGIPLAAALPLMEFTLLERSSKRAAFLKNCALLLGLGNVRVLEADLLEATGEYDAATFRAFAPLDRFFADLSRARVRCRAVAAYKGREARAREELERMRGEGLAFDAEITRVQVPFMEEERHIVSIRLRD